MFEREDVLVTGGSGLIGRQLIRLLLQKGANVKTIIGSRSLPGDLVRKAEARHIDLTDPRACRKAVEGVRYVFHLAAFVGGVKQNLEHPATMMTKNLMINSNVIDAAQNAGVERYAFVSCGCVYPDLEGEISEDVAWKAPPARSAVHFGWAKRIGELQAQAYMKEFGMKTAIIRPSNSYGPGDLYDKYGSHVIPAFILKAVERQDPFMIWGNGESKRDFIYSEDAARGIMLAMEKYAIGDPINISTGIPVSINDLAKKILYLSGYENAKIMHGSSHLSGASSKVLSYKKAKEKLGFEPTVTLEQGLKITVESYVKEALVPS